MRARALSALCGLCTLVGVWVVCVRAPRRRLAAVGLQTVRVGGRGWGHNKHNRQAAVMSI